MIASPSFAAVTAWMNMRGRIAEPRFAAARACLGDLRGRRCPADPSTDPSFAAARACLGDLRGRRCPPDPNTQTLALQLRAPAWATCAAGAARPRPARAPPHFQPCRAARRRTPPPPPGTRLPLRRAAVRRAQALRQHLQRLQARELWAASLAPGQHIGEGRGTRAAAARP